MAQSLVPRYDLPRIADFIDCNVFIGVFFAVIYCLSINVALFVFFFQIRQEKPFYMADAEVDSLVSMTCFDKNSFFFFLGGTFLINCKRFYRSDIPLLSPY